MKISIPGKSNGIFGFTLIELSVVLFIISLVIWTALPRLSLLTGDDDRSFLTKVSAHLENSMEETLFTSSGGTIDIDFQEGVIEGFTGEREERKKQWSVVVPTSLVLDSVTTNFGKTYLTDRVSIPLSPMGFLPSTKIYLRGKNKDKTFTMKLNSFSGRVEISDEPE